MGLEEKLPSGFLLTTAEKAAGYAGLLGAAGVSAWPGTRWR